jgi:hypothetical protein
MTGEELHAHLEGLRAHEEFWVEPAFIGKRKAVIAKNA